MQMTTHDQPDELISKLFHETMIADEWHVKEVKRSFLTGKKESYDDRHHLTFVTSDDRVAEVIEECASWSKGREPDNVPFDLVVIPLATGSKDYIEWVKLQSLKKDDDTAFFNE